jgi:hypothetical protein
LAEPPPFFFLVEEILAVDKQLAIEIQFDFRQQDILRKSPHPGAKSPYPAKSPRALLLSPKTASPKPDLANFSVPRMKNTPRVSNVLQLPISGGGGVDSASPFKPREKVASPFKPYNKSASPSPSAAKTATPIAANNKIVLPSPFKATNEHVPASPIEQESPSPFKKPKKRKGPIKATRTRLAQRKKNKVEEEED